MRRALRIALIVIIQTGLAAVGLALGYFGYMAVYALLNA